MAEFARVAAQGALVGWTLGAQCRGRRAFRRLDFFDPIPPRMAQSDAIEAWLVWSAHLGRGNPCTTLYRSLADSWAYHVHESVFGLSNISQGLATPICGAHANPLAGGSRAIGRAVYWGIAFHGLPDVAAEFAYYDAAIDHSGDGVWVPVALARTVALAEPGRPVSQVLRDFTESLPPQSGFLKAIPQIVKDFDSPDGPKELRERLPGALGIADPFDAVLSACWTSIGLLRGGGAFEPSVAATAGCGGAADHATLACGALAAILSNGVPQAWTKPVGDTFVCGHGLRSVDPPKSIETFLKTVEADAEAHARQPQPVPESAEAAQPPAPEPAVDPKMSAETLLLISREPNIAVFEHASVRAAVKYVDGPVVTPGSTLSLSIALTNLSGDDATLATSVVGPEGWELAHKMGEVFLAANGSQSFAIVVRPPKGLCRGGRIAFKVGEAQFVAPVLPSQLWYSVGPMLNQEGTGFDKEYPAQSNIRLGQMFNGRSDMPVEWTARNEPGVFFEVERLMGDGPGTAYYYAVVELPSAGKYRIVVASGVGAIVWIDGHKTFWYHDTHTPVPHPTEPYVGTFQTEGEVRVLIKTFRNLQPVPPMAVYFLAEDGSLAVPTGFSPIE